MNEDVELATIEDNSDTEIVTLETIENEVATLEEYIKHYNDYEDLINKPAISGVELNSETTKQDLGLTTDDIPETATNMYVPTLPIENTQAKYLNGNKEWQEISIRHNQLRDLNGDSDYQHITTNEVSLIHTEQQVYVLSGSAGSSFSLKTPSNINITSYEIETDVNCTAVISIDGTSINLTNEKSKTGTIAITKLENESITVSVDSNDNANWIKVYLNGVKL